MSDDQTPDPEDTLRKMMGLPTKADVDKQKMAVSIESHDTYSWFDSASENDLTRIKLVVGSIISAASGASGAAMQAAFWQGYATAKLEQHHGICPSCGKNHMEELQGE